MAKNLPRITNTKLFIMSLLRRTLKIRNMLLPNLALLLANSLLLMNTLLPTNTTLPRSALLLSSTVPPMSTLLLYYSGYSTINYFTIDEYSGIKGYSNIKENYATKRYFTTWK